MRFVGRTSSHAPRAAGCVCVVYSSGPSFVGVPQPQVRRKPVCRCSGDAGTWRPPRFKGAVDCGVRCLASNVIVGGSSRGEFQGDETTEDSKGGGKVSIVGRCSRANLHYLGWWWVHILKCELALLCVGPAASTCCYTTICWLSLVALSESSSSFVLRC